MQHYAGVYLLHVSGVYSTHHQEYIKLGHAGGRLLLWHYDLYQKLQLQFDVLLMMGTVDTRNM